MKYFTRPNLTCEEVSLLEGHPSSLLLETTDEKGAMLYDGGARRKAEFVEHTRKPSTVGHHLSTLEGLNPGMRVGSDNPGAKLYGLIADYDSKVSLTPAKLESIQQKSVGAFPPTYVSRTQSGNARIVWEFEQPILIRDHEHFRRFTKKFFAQAKARGLLSGFDSCAERPHQYFQLGDSWVQLSDQPVSSAAVFGIETYVSKSTDWSALAATIPLPAVEAEMNLRFPGRWDGAFELGEKGVRFWDSSADSPRSATIRESGMQCFTGNEAFRSWASIFGDDWVRTYETERLSGATSKSHFDGKSFWIETATGWRSIGQSLYAGHLRASGLSGKAGSGGGEASEVDAAIDQVLINRYVDGVAAVPFQPSGTLAVGDKQILNTSRVKAIKPADDRVKVEEKIPFLTSYFNALFETSEQKNVFLAWMKIFYAGAYQQKPKRGQALLIGGGAGLGKTLLNTRVIGALVGGFTDASEYLTGSTKFNGSLFEKGLWAVDDATPADYRKAQSYTALVKKMVANTQHQTEEKFQKSAMIEWKGRLCITFNLDSNGLQVLPDPDQSMRDKMHILKARNEAHGFIFPEDVEEQITHELPYLAAYLLEWDGGGLIDWVKYPRYGMAAFHNEELISEAQRATPANSTLELLELFFRKTGRNYWEGNTVMLLQALIDDAGDVAKEQNALRLGRNLGTCADKYPTIVTKVMRGEPGGLQRGGWRITAPPSWRIGDDEETGQVTDLRKGGAS